MGIDSKEQTVVNKESIKQALQKMKQIFILVIFDLTNIIIIQIHRERYVLLPLAMIVMKYIIKMNKLLIRLQVIIIIELILVFI